MLFLDDFSNSSGTIFIHHCQVDQGQRCAANPQNPKLQTLKHKNQ